MQRVSIHAETKKSYHSMDRRFHPDKNIGLDTTEMMKMINEAKNGFFRFCMNTDRCSNQYPEHIITSNA